MKFWIPKLFLRNDVYIFPRKQTFVLQGSSEQLKKLKRMRELKRMLCALGEKMFYLFFKTLENVRIDCGPKKQELIEINLKFAGFYFSCH